MIAPKAVTNYDGGRNPPSFFFTQGAIMNLKISGIYQIRNTGNDRKYIAASEDINKSIKKDFLLLKTKKHKCKQLQDEWNVQTSSSFVFEIVKQNVETAKLIDELNKNLEISKNCIYDIQSIEKREKVESAGMFSKDDVFNIRNEYKNGNVTTYDLAEKWKTRQSNIVSILHNATYYDPGYVFEKQEIIRKSSNLDWEKVKNIRSLYGNSIISMDDLAKMFQTSTPTVCKIINNVSWVDLNYHKSNIVKEGI